MLLRRSVFVLMHTINATPLRQSVRVLTLNFFLMRSIKFLAMSWLKNYCCTQQINTIASISQCKNIAAGLHNTTSFFKLHYSTRLLTSAVRWNVLVQPCERQFIIILPSRWVKSSPVVSSCLPLCAAVPRDSCCYRRCSPWTATPPTTRGNLAHVIMITMLTSDNSTHW